MKAWLFEYAERHQIEILFACEAGSRAWNLETDQSDYDIRLVFRYKDLTRYLSLSKPQSTLNVLKPYDVQGFDIYKAMELIQKSNPSIYEWAYSPVKYIISGSFVSKLQEVIEQEFSPFTLHAHYTSLKRNNLKDIKDKIYNFKRQKQLIHAIRAEMMCRAIQRAQRVRSPLIFLEDCKNEEKKLYDMYEVAGNAKKQNKLLQEKIVSEIIHFLMFEQKLSKTILASRKPDLELLDSWLANVLGAGNTCFEKGKQS